MNIYSLVCEMLKSGCGTPSTVFHFYHNFAVPAPTSVSLSSSIPNPIPPFGSDVTLTCAVELSPAVDVPVTVNMVLTPSHGFVTTGTAQPVMGSLINYATEFTIRSFRRSDSGLYTCAATVSLPSHSTNAYVSDSSTASHSVRVTTGEILIYSASHVLITLVIIFRSLSGIERSTHH